MKHGVYINGYHTMTFPRNQPKIIKLRSKRQKKAKAWYLI